MKYLHTMIRVRDLDATLKFFCEGLGLKETRRQDNAAGKYTLVFLAADETPDAEIELTHNWGSTEDYGSARNFGHLAFRVDDIYATCAHLQSIGRHHQSPAARRSHGLRAFAGSGLGRAAAEKRFRWRRRSRGHRCRTAECGEGGRARSRGPDAAQSG